MPARFFCPHCHASLDQVAMDVDCSDQAELRICRVCDLSIGLDQTDFPPSRVTTVTGPMEETKLNPVLETMA